MKNYIKLCITSVVAVILLTCRDNDLKRHPLVEVLYDGNINVWTDEPEQEIAGIKGLEGVSFVLLIDDPIFVYTDAYYDTDAIADEIRLLLAAEVPGAFNE